MRNDGRDGYRIGAKFDQYLELNLRLVRAQYVGAAAGAVLLLTEQWFFMIIGLWAVCGCIFSVYAKLFSETLYHKQACLYQSVPVSAFETALVKTLAGSVAPLLAVMVYVGGSLLMVDSEGDSGLYLYRQLLELGSTVDNMGISVALGILNAAVVPFVTCGMILFAVAVGNRVRENRDKSPKKWAIFLVIALLVAAQAGITWFIGWIPVLSMVQEQAVSLLFNLVCAAGMLVVNTRVLERWYSA